MVSLAVVHMHTGPYLSILQYYWVMGKGGEMCWRHPQTVKSTMWRALIFRSGLENRGSLRSVVARLPPILYCGHRPLCDQGVWHVVNREYNYNVGNEL